MKSRIILILIIACQCCFALLGRSRRNDGGSQQPSVVELLSPLQHSSPAQWHQGMPFVFIGQRIGFSLIPEVPSESDDSLSVYGERWFYESMVSEEDWMGQELLQLRFRSPSGRAFRYNTGRPMSSMADTAFHPALGVLYPEALIMQCDSILRARTFFILYNDERVEYTADSTPGRHTHLKFVPIVIDSIRSGSEVAPLRVCFTAEDGSSGSFLTSLPGSRQVSTSTPISRFLASVDPYLSHPDITPDAWTLIQQSQLAIDMTAEEVRLSWGRPSKTEKVNTRNGIIELWFYGNNRVVQIWDGRLNKIGIL